MNTTESLNTIIRKDAEMQLEFCVDLVLALRRDWSRNKRKEKIQSWAPVANVTQLQSDIRKLRRELLYLNEILSKRGAE